MEIFDAHKKIIDHYESYIKSFINISDQRIREKVLSELDNRLLWPDPLIQFNPGYEAGETFSQLCNDGVLHRDISSMFNFIPHKHQEQAIRKGVDRNSFVVTSGTGSGKSLAYLVPIFDHVMKNPGTQSDASVKALLVYPMNALINSQFQEIEKFGRKFSDTTGRTFPVKFDKYTGQESEAEKERIINDRPDIILTNYMMLELLLVRPKERRLRNSILGNLEFLVFDELHTYRGRQGADVAMLIRRIRNSVTNQNFTCIGTSATLATEIDGKTKSEQIADSATAIFGIEFNGSDIIEESLTTTFSGLFPSKEGLASYILDPIEIDIDPHILEKSPLANWIEQAIALIRKGDRWERREPMTEKMIVSELSNYTDVDESDCRKRLQLFFEQLKKVNKELTDLGKTGFYLPFKLHQFIKQTGLVYLTFEQPSERIITLDPLPFVEKDGRKLVLFPSVFSRFTGVEFYRVMIDEVTKTLKPWTEEFRSAGNSEDEIQLEYGYVILSPETGEDFWNGPDDYEKLPSGWFKETKRKGVEPEKKYAQRMPKRIYVNQEGKFSEVPSEGYLAAWLMKEKLLFDITSIMIYPPRSSDNTKLARLGNEGRSTATTILTTGIINSLSEMNADKSVRKVLSFIDNRQDAALQSGHFNDFMKIALLRASINAAVNLNTDIDFSNISHHVFDQMGLSQYDYAEQPVEGLLALANENAFKSMLFYDIVLDLQKSWRFVLPNLEQCGLLKIRYKSLEEQVFELSKNIESFSDFSSEQKLEKFFQLLEYIRSQFGIHSAEFEKNKLEQNLKIINEKLNARWKLSEGERLEEPNWMTVEKTSFRNIFTESLHATSAWGKFLKFEMEQAGHRLSKDEIHNLTYSMLNHLVAFGYLRRKDDADVPMYRLNLDVINWMKGDGSMVRDKVRIRTHASVTEPRPNEYFRNFYSLEPARIRNRISGEHTGQLKNELRQHNEAAFRHEPEIPKHQRLCALYCSPTMELGIDISDLVAVHMRNVPPSPANYIQRSGRAGRSGQGALIFTYCGQFNPHDRHYFDNRINMVAGLVKPIYIDFKNEELWLTHFHSVILGIIGIEELKSSIGDVIDFEQPDMPLRNSVKTQIESITSNNQTRNSAIAVMSAMMSDDRHIAELRETYWYNDKWIEQKLSSTPMLFDEAFNRWREMYRKAEEAKTKATHIIESPVISHSSPEWRAARSEQQRSQIILDMLKNESAGNRDEAEFFPYRYLASEGFLPGYNFTRLPIRAILHDRYSKTNVISRPRSLALTEFGPDNIIYYNGSKFGIERMDLHSRVRTEEQNEFGMEKMKVFEDSGYVLLNSEVSRNSSPFQTLLEDSPQTRVIGNVIPLQNMYATVSERIGCDEEERMRKGYERDVFFHHENILQVMKNVVRVSKDDYNYLNLRYIPSADLVFINYRWRTSVAQRDNGGFAIDERTGEWLSEKDVKKRIDENRADWKRVHLYTKDTADALYIEPLPQLDLTPSGAITMMFALKRAIVDFFQLEQSEIGVQFMGNRNVPNLFIYESAEGSLGILSQVAKKPDLFREIAKNAYELCSFKDGEDIHPDGEKHKASYDDLLDYYNQRYHEEINRFEIKSALEKLISSSYDIQPQRNYEEQYKYLINRYDESSVMEFNLINYLHDNKLRLPDQAQKQMSENGCYASADFFCDPNICIFCDGSVHDNEDIQAQDREKRECLQRNGFKVLVWNYVTKVNDFVEENKNLFKPVIIEGEN